MKPEGYSTPRIEGPAPGKPAPLPLPLPVSFPLVFGLSSAYIQA